MNQKNLNDIFEHYIEKFEYINGPENGEIYKWQIANQFRSVMDEALASSDEEFPNKLYVAKKLSANIVDSYLQPFYGLVKFAEKEPGTVREMFLELFKDDGGDLVNRQQRILHFLNSSHSLRDKYYKESYLYTDDYHSVTSYLALYDPHNNYILKQTQSRKFAECVEFYEDWGTGENVDLAVYYKMCDELVESIKKDAALMKTDASRFDPKLGFGDLYPDEAKHILAFDIIYCSTVYDLYSGISIVKRSAKERSLYEERKEKAKELKVQLDGVYAQKQRLDEACKAIETAFSIGTEVEHFKQGTGTISEVGEGYVCFLKDGADKPIKLGIPLSYVKGILRLKDGTIPEAEENMELLLMHDKIPGRVSYAEGQFAPYADDLE